MKSSILNFRLWNYGVHYNTLPLEKPVNTVKMKFSVTFITLYGVKTPDSFLAILKIETLVAYFVKTLCVNLTCD